MYRSPRPALLLSLLLGLLGCESPSSPPAASSGPDSPAQATAPAQPTRVDGAKARALVADGATLLDVRTQGEWDRGHIEGAKLIPVQELDGRLEEVGPKETPVVVYCASGARSASAAKTLARAGWTQVHDLGGMGNW